MCGNVVLVHPSELSQTEDSGWLFDHYKNSEIVWCLKDQLGKDRQKVLRNLTLEGGSDPLEDDSQFISSDYGLEFIN